MWASGQRVVEGVEEEGVMTVGTSYPAHTRHIGQRRGHRGRGRQVDDPLAVWPKVRQFGNFLFLLHDNCVSLPGTGDPLAAALADEQTVAGTPHIFPPGRGVSDGRGLIALGALDNMLQTQSSLSLS